ncbi:unnamed protein product [Lasius platythorax]|uniref:Uncharacterized protein n=1 Tax=Lasius platythorax TaxID=488582 RepID=A0AAV2P6H3_9HYME
MSAVVPLTLSLLAKKVHPDEIFRKTLGSQTGGRRGFQRPKCLISDPLDESEWREEAILGWIFENRNAKVSNERPSAQLFPRVCRFARRRESHFWSTLNRLSRLFDAILPRRDQPR